MQQRQSTRGTPPPVSNHWFAGKAIWRTAVLLLIPVVLLAAVLYAWLEWSTRQGLDTATRTVVQQFELSLRRVEMLLTDHAGAHGLACTDAAVQDLRRLAFQAETIREAGVVRDEQIVCTSWGRTDPPIAVNPRHRTRQADGVFVTTIRDSALNLGGHSVMLAVVQGAGDQVNALLSPIALFQPQLLAGPAPLSVRVQMDAGHAVTFERPGTAGQMVRVQDEPADQARAFVPPRHHVVTRLDRYGLTITASCDTAALHRAWLPVFGWAVLTALAGVALALWLAHRDRARHYAPERAIARALRAGEFEFHYQPQVALDTGACIGAEALIRWNHDTRGLLLPALFLGAALSSGQIAPITLAATRRACADLGEALRARRIRVAINIDAQHFDDPTFFDAMGEIIHAAGVPPEQIVFEVTETSLFDRESADLDVRLEQLKQAGYGVAIDDFGTGYCSFDYLRRFPVDYLKIDRSFVAGVGVDSVGQRLLETIIQLGLGLNLTLVAEGVEDDAQRDFLHASGAHVAQGFLFSPAVPAPEFLDYCERRSV